MEKAIRKVLLINPPWYRLFGEKKNSAPLGLCYIAAVLRERGYDVLIYDSDLSHHGARIPIMSRKGKRLENYLDALENEQSPVWQEIEETIRQQAPDLVGITVYTPTYRSALSVSQIAKRLNPSLPVVWGGIHPTALPEETLRLKEVDIVVRGEGELTFLDLLENWGQPERVPGISFKDSQGSMVANPSRPLIKDLNQLPFPAKDLLRGPEGCSHFMGNLFATRGCPYSCIFCGSHRIWTRRVRFRSPQNVVAEIRHLRDRYGVIWFSFEDDSFTVNWPWVREVCDGIIGEKLAIRWRCETRVDLLTAEMAHKLKQAGCEEVELGVESGSEETLRRIHKGITVEQAREAARILHRAGLEFRALFMVGFPWETRKDIEATLRLMKELEPFFIQLNIATPYPGTELYQLCLSEGSVFPDLDWATFYLDNPGMFFSRHFSPQEAYGIMREAQDWVDGYNLAQKRRLLWRRPWFAVQRAAEHGFLRPARFGELLRYIWG